LTLVEELPSGTVTFLFTDVERSTTLLDELGPERFGAVLEEHRVRLRKAFAAGHEVDTQGDALFYAFARAGDAVEAAAAGQRSLDGLPLRVRMGLHTGEPTIVGDGYVGIDVHRAARICSAAHGGQVVLSQTTRDLADAPTRDLGEHRLKDLSQPQRLHQLVAEGLASNLPPLQSLENRPTNLPVQATPLVGRAEELRDVAALLTREDIRLVTLTGPGGTGKTRLALHAAAEAIERFPNGVWFVALDAIAAPELVLPTIAQTLGVVEPGNRPLVDAVADHLRDQRLLLVLDNFEQLLAAAPVLARLLAASRESNLLVTSRAPLRLAAEHCFQVPPLRLPDLGTQDLDALSQYEAVALFVQRARAVAPTFAITDDNAPAVAELCVRLDGLPLAIELAAARVKLLPPQALLARLGQRLDLLKGGPRDRPERQQTLRATLDWSFDLLDEEQRRRFARLAVFAGGFRMEAAEAVCDAGLETIEALLEISLLRSEERPDGEPRFLMLETIREYAGERLAQHEESAEFRERHARWIGDWLEARLLERARGAPGPALDWRREDEEHDNARAALAWARDAGDIDRELQLVASAGSFYWPNRGLLSEGRRWLEDVLERSEGADARLRALAMVAAAHLAWRQGDGARCEELAAAAQPLLQRHEDRPFLAFALIARAIAAQARGAAEEAAAFNDEAETLFRELGHAEAPNSILNNRVYDELVAGNFAEAEPRLRELVAGSTGELRFAVLANHGLALARLGRLSEAAASFAGIFLDTSTTPRSAEIQVYGLEGLATVAGKRGDDARAARLWGASAALRDELELALGPAEQLFHDDVVAEVQGRLGDDAFERAWHEGRGLSAHDAVELALLDP
jgi:predicted ATPase/class 3 adenylate cyclase